MTEWWYIAGGKKMGPVTGEELKSLLQKEKVTHSTKVWHQGLSEWTTFCEVEELQLVSAAVPPPLPDEAPADWTSYPLAGKWKRFFARYFDLWWESLLVVLSVSYVLSRTSSDYLEFLNTNPSSGTIVALACLPLVLVFDTVVCAIFGNSPGKALLGVRAIKEASGEKLGFSDHFARNLGVWISGLAMGLPLISLFTMSSQSKRVDEGRKASYDDGTGVTVKAKPIGWLRVAAFCIPFSALLMIIGALNVLGKEEQSEMFKAQLEERKGPTDWRNPETSKIVPISPNWTYKADKNGQGGSIYMFTNRSEHALVILAAENLRTADISEYVNLFREGTKKDMRFEGPQGYSTSNGRESWSGSGYMVADPENHLKVEIRQSGAKFWRAVVVQSPPYDYTDDLVKELKTALWDSVPITDKPIITKKTSGYGDVDL